MKRLRCIAWRAVLLGALGLATSVAVAWGLAAWLPNEHCYSSVSEHHRGFRAYPDLEVRRYERPGMVRRHWLEISHAPGFDLYETWAVRTDTKRDRPWMLRGWEGGSWGVVERVKGLDPRVPDHGLDDARGWPVVCLWYSATNFPSGIIGGGAMNTPGNPFGPTPRATVIHGGIELPPATGISGDSVRALPVMPIWRGLGINAAFYGVLWWAGIAAATGTRRWRRWRRCLCPECAYDLKHGWGAGCPECGWARAVGTASAGG